MNRAVILVAIGLCLFSSSQVIAAADFFVDSPRVNTWREPEIEIGGWIWGGSKDPVVRVALESGVWSHPLDFGLERGDVAAYLDEPGASLSGFYAQLKPPASASLNLVAYRQSGAQIALKTIRYRPVKPSALWQPWLEQYPEWRQDPFWFALGTSGISTGGDQGFSEAYSHYRSDTFRIGLRVPILYMRSTQGRAKDWQFDPDLGRVLLDSGVLLVDDWLEGLIELSIEKSLPILFTLNGGVWGDANGGLPDYDLTDYLELDPRNCQWDQHDKVYPDDLVAGLPGSLTSPELSRVLTLNAYNDTVRMYKKRNLQSAGRRLAEFAAQHPSLFAGINLDADVYLSPFVKGSWHDFNPDTLRQFRDWLGGNGLYADGAILASYREQALTLAEVSEIAQKSYSQWSEVAPPRDMPRQFLPGESEPWMHLWERFRRHLVDLHYDDLSRWLVEVGIDSEKIYSSQGFMAPRKAAMPFSERLDSSLKNFDSAGMTVEGARPTPGHLGAIIYGQSAMNNIETESGRSLFKVFYDTDPDWGIVEHNTADFRDPSGQSPAYGEAYASLRELFNFHARVLSPMAWNGSNGDFSGAPEFHAHTAYRNTPLEDAVSDFLSEYAFLPRQSLYWPFGNEHHVSADGWYKTDKQTLLWADKGVLRWRHPEAQLRLTSPPGLAIEAAVHTTLVLGAKGGGRLRSIGVEFVDGNERELGWQVATVPVPVAGLERSDAGWVVPLMWSTDAQPEHIRLVLETGSQGEMMIDQIAILPTGAP